MGAFDRIKLSAKDVPSMLRAAFPNYHGRKWYADVTTKVCLGDTQWGGGSRNQYMAVNLETGQMSPPLRSAIGTWPDMKEPMVELHPGVVIVEHSIFMGKDTGITIHVHPENVQRMLPAAASAGGGKRRHVRSHGSIVRRREAKLLKWLGWMPRSKAKDYNPNRYDFEWNKDYTKFRARPLKWWDDASYARYQADDPGAYEGGKRRHARPGVGASAAELRRLMRK